MGISSPPHNTLEIAAGAVKPDDLVWVGDGWAHVEETRHLVHTCELLIGYFGIVTLPLRFPVTIAKRDDG
jgi:hypothetical protein